MRDISDTLEKKLYECDKHVQKLYDAKEFLADIMPLTLEKYQNIDKIQSSFIDQLNFRFSKLQDTVGESIIKSLLILAKEPVEKMTFLDMLNRLDKLEILEKDRWLELREARNEIAHEYSFNQQEVVDNINLIYKKTDELVMVYKKLHKYIEELL